MNSFVFAALGRISDDLISNLYCDIHGTHNESSNFQRNMMERYGVWRSTPIRQCVSQGVALGGGALLYCLDKYLECDAQDINFHKIWLYGIGAVSYLEALNGCILYLKK